MGESYFGDDEDEDFAESWRPEPNDELAGTVVSRSSRPGWQGEVYPILTIELDDNTRLAWHAFHTVAKNEIENLNIGVGDFIAIKYQGKRKPKRPGGSKFHGWRVKVIRRAEKTAAPVSGNPF